MNEWKIKIGGSQYFNCATRNILNTYTLASPCVFRDCFFISLFLTNTHKYFFHLDLKQLFDTSLHTLCASQLMDGKCFACVNFDAELNYNIIFLMHYRFGDVFIFITIDRATAIRSPKLRYKRQMYSNNFRKNKWINSRALAIERWIWAWLGRNLRKSHKTRVHCNANIQLVAILHMQC